MTTMSAIAPGTFCWPELCSADAAASKKFYSGLFGWTSEEMHMPEGDYTIFKLDDDAVGGMYQLKPERQQAGVKPHWNSYAAVENADETAKQAKALGGKVLMEPVDAPDGSRMATIQDPTGAVVSIWQGKAGGEPVRLGETGALCWTELYTRDTARAVEFYLKLFRWKAEAWHGGAKPYTIFKPTGNEMGTGGMLEITPEMGQMPAQWLPYFMVTDTHKTVARVKELGGKAWCDPMEIPTIGLIAFFSDTQGAGFAVIKPMMGKK